MRYVIKGPNGLYYNDNKVLRSEDEIQKDAQGNKSVGQRMIIEPVFKGAEKNDALKYGDEASATAMLTHPDLDDAQAFAGAVVEEFPFDGY